MPRLLAGLGLLLFAAASHAGTETTPGGGAAVPIPEPMVFDLVRGLGARKGELEANTLVTLPFDSDDPVGYLVAPEIEYAFADDWAVEFELPFEEGGLAAVKLAGQWTFGAKPEAGFIHGTQLIAERLVDVDAWELSLLYIPGWRFDDTWSVLVMIGATSLFGSEIESDVGVLANITVFADVRDGLVLGLEVDSAFLEDGTSVLIMPQVHYELSEHWTLQFGIGVLYFEGRAVGPGLVPALSPADGWFPQASLRVVYEF